MTLPRFQPQSPALSGYSLGWLSCTAFSAAMAASFDAQVPVRVTGAQVRQRTGDTTGGLTLAQVDYAVEQLTGIALDVRYRLSWGEFVRRIDAGQGAVLQGHSSVFVGTTFNDGASVNHAIFVPPGWAAMDPAADGRRAGVYDRRTKALPYPPVLLRKFAGRLILNPATGARLGDGLVYAAFTRDRVASGYRVSIQPSTGNDKRQYAIFDVVAGIARFREYGYTGGFSAACTAPHAYATGAGTVSLVRIMPPSNKAGQYVRSKWAKEVYP